MKFYHNYATKIEFRRSVFDGYLYYYSTANVPVFIFLCADDILLMSSNMKLLCDVKFELSNLFEMKNLGEASKILDMSITRNKNNNLLYIDQKNYLCKFLYPLICMNKNLIVCL